MPRDAANGFNHLANAKAASGTEIVDKLVTLTQSVEDQNVGAGQIAYVNVVANTGAIGRGIICAENGDVVALSECYLQRKWNKVRLRHMIFAQSAGCSGSVEIAKAGVPQAVYAVEPGEHLLDQQFRFTVRVGRPQWISLFNWCALRGSIKGRRRGKH